MATPGRTTRSRSRQATPQPLPAVDVRQSHAFGSRGRAHLQDQIAAAGTTLAEGFTTARAGANIAPVLEEDEDDEELLQPAMSRQGTYVGSYANYESPVHSQRHDSMPPPSPRRARSPAGTTDDAPVSPWTFSVILFAVPRYLWRNFWTLLVGALLLGTIAHIKMPARAADRRDEFFRGLKIAVGVPGYDQPPSKLERMWMYVRYEAFSKEELDKLPPIKDPLLQQLVNVRLRGLITDLGYNQTLFQGNLTALEERVAQMEDFLPPRMVVDVVDGNMIISDSFWNAITSKIEGSNDLFDAFVAANEESATRIAENIAAGHLEEAVQNKRVLNRDGLMEILDENSRQLEKRLTSLVQSGTNDAINAARTIAAQVAREVAENAPNDLRAQLSVLAKSNILANTYSAMSSVNYFSPKMGAIVDPHHTSPTFLEPPKLPKAGWFAKSLKRMTPSPVAALLPYEETGDCWCAAKSEDERMGQAQIAVITKEEFIPDRLIVEYIPKGGSENIKTAPRDYELWAESSSVERAETLNREMREGRKATSVYDTRCKHSLIPPTESSVLLLCGSYDIDAENWAQSSAMPIAHHNMLNTDFTPGKFYFRALSNWGANQTCIYRLRLTKKHFKPEDLWWDGVRFSGGDDYVV